MPRRRVGRWRRSECAGRCRSRHRPATAPVRVRDPAGGGPGAGEAPGADAPRSAPRQPAGLHPQVAEVLRAQPIEPAGPNTSTSPPHGRLRSAASGSPVDHARRPPFHPVGREHREQRRGQVDDDRHAQPSSTQENHQVPSAPRVAQLIRNKPALTTANTNRWTYSPWIDLARSRACSYSASRDEVWSDAVALPSSSFDDISFTSSTSLASWSDWRQGRAPRPTRAARRCSIRGPPRLGQEGWGPGGTGGPRPRPSTSPHRRSPGRPARPLRRADQPEPTRRPRRVGWRSGSSRFPPRVVVAAAFPWSLRRSGKANVAVADPPQEVLPVQLSGRWRPSGSRSPTCTRTPTRSTYAAIA